MKRILLGLLIIVFLFIRFYRVDKSLYFYNDMGRDYQVLYDWKEGNKIPFMGPQTSALPINQSPIYFYFLMPFYIFTKGSVYTSLIACSVLYILTALIALNLSKENKTLKRIALFGFVLIIFHPQIILQNRFIWNPSLLPPLILLSLLLYFKYFIKGDKKDLFWSILLINLSISLNYSVAPLLVVYVLVFVLNEKKNWFYLAKYVAITFIGLNISMLAQVLKRFLLSGSFINKDQIFQTGSTLTQKLIEYIDYVLATDNRIIGSILLVAIFLTGLYLLFFSKSKITKIGVQIFVGTSLLTLFSPFNLQSHYIFAILITFFVFLSLINIKIQLPILLVLLFFYLQPKLVKSYFKDAPRTYNQMDQCFKKFCSSFKEPLYVSVQSDLYPYHFGPEHRYLMMKNGCQVKSIERGNNEADNMAVVLDSGSFSEKTNYYELELFGKFKEDFNMECQNNFKIVLLSK